MMTTLRYSPNRAGLDIMDTLVALYQHGNFSVPLERYEERISVDNRSRIVLNDATLADSGFYDHRAEYKESGVYEYKVELRVGGIYYGPTYTTPRFASGAALDFSFS